MSTNWNRLRVVLFVIVPTKSVYNVAFSFTWSSDCSEADVDVGHKASDNFMDYWTQVISDEQINVYTMCAATVTTLIKWPNWEKNDSVA